MSHLCYIEPPLSDLFSLLCSFLFIFWRICGVCPNSASAVVSVGCYINIVGRKPVLSVESREVIAGVGAG